MTKRDSGTFTISLVPENPAPTVCLPAFAATSHYRFQESLQDYLGFLANQAVDLAAIAAARKEMLMRHLENRYRRFGGGHCAECNAPVRDVMRVVSSDASGKTRSYECLCRRCIEAERAYTSSLSLYVDSVVFERTENRKPPVERPGREEKIAA